MNAPVFTGSIFVGRLKKKLSFYAHAYRSSVKQAHHNNEQKAEVFLLQSRLKKKKHAL